MRIACFKKDLGNFPLGAATQITPCLVSNATL